MKKSGIIVITVLALIFIIVVFFKISSSNNSKMHFDTKNSEEVNSILDMIENNLNKNKVKYEVKKAKNDKVYSMLIKIDNGTQDMYEGYNIDINTGKSIGYEDVLNKYNIKKEDVLNKIKKQLKKYYDDEAKYGYIDPNECDLDCYIKSFRNIENIEYSYVIYVENNKIYAYIEFDEDSIVDDKTYFDSLKTNPHEIEI